MASIKAGTTAGLPIFTGTTGVLEPKTLQDAALALGISNRNILVNGDFAVNQRGQGSYTGVGHAVDMWAIRGANGAAQIVDGGITWTMPNIGAPTMWQLIEQYKNYAGKLVTASVECPVVSETSKWSLHVHDGMNAASQPITHTGITTTSLVVSESAIRLNVYLLNTSADNTPITTSRAKLELGPISTLALDGPADYGAELDKCKRYYETGYASLFTTKPVAQGGTLYSPIRILFQKQKRIVPSITILSADGSRNVIYDDSTGENITLTSITPNADVNSFSPALKGISAEKPAGTKYSFYYVASAEL